MVRKVSSRTNESFSLCNGAMEMHPQKYHSLSLMNVSLMKTIQSSANFAIYFFGIPKMMENHSSLQRAANGDSSP